MPRIYATTNPEKSEREARNERKARRIAAEGMVLLKNNGVLPLKAGCAIALYGGGARKTVKGGTGSGDVNVRAFSTVEQGLEDAGFSVLTKGWLDKFDAAAQAAEAEKQRRTEEIKAQNLGFIQTVQQVAELDGWAVVPPAIEAEDIAADCDTAIYVLARNSGEGLDRRVAAGDYLLYEEEKENLRALTAAYAQVVVVLNVGGVIDTRFLRTLPGVGAILLMSQGGCMGGNALADVLSGKVTPSGHLTTTWAEKYEDYPNAATFATQNGNLDDEYYTEGIFVGYRYFDSFGIQPAYPFGYGLSYTTFDIQTQNVRLDGEEVAVAVTATNSGKDYSGKSVVQVYASAPAGRIEKPYQILVAYAKTKELAPGESETLTLTFPVTAMACYSEAEAAWLLEAGNYYIRVGAHSRDTHIAAALVLAEACVTERLSNRFHPDNSFEELSAKEVSAYTYDGEDTEKRCAPVIDIPVGTISCKQAVYSGENQPLPCAQTVSPISLDDVRSGKYTLDALVSQLTVEEMTELCVGIGWDTSLHTGADAILCPGSVGGTSSALLEAHGIRNMVLSDGPAGLRLNTEFLTDGENRLAAEAKVTVLPGMGVPDVPNENPEPVAEGIHHYQYATAIPIATLLAQTWDIDAIEAAGAIVGEEMVEFGVDLWLGPAMNIHRNPLCGRNFEYFSEDPLVSGQSAAAEVFGVQKCGYVGATLKHFALNNQESNRLHNNAYARERTIRELYIKGFEIAVRKAHPFAIMTSYNLLNGVHTANDYDLITAVARDEWGFDGVVMTDWATTGFGIPGKHHKYDYSNAAGCIQAGNDLIMPGYQGDKDEILRSVGRMTGEVEYPIPLADLQACTKRILETVLRCRA